MKAAFHFWVNYPFNYFLCFPFPPRLCHWCLFFKLSHFSIAFFLFVPLSPPLTFFRRPSFIHTWPSRFPHSVVNVIWASISRHRLQYICEHNHVHTSPTLTRSCSISLVHVVWTPIKRLNHSFWTCRLSSKAKAAVQWSQSFGHRRDLLACTKTMPRCCLH